MMFLETFLIALAIVLLCAVGMGIGLLLTGKSKLKKMCGLPPQEQKDCYKKSCTICHKKKNS
jgi:hypothetical protein